MEVAYSIKNSKYVIRLCVENNVDKHYELVRALVVDTDEITYKTRMLECIENSTAYEIIKDEVCVGFLYLYEDNKIWYGRSIYSEDLLGLVVCMVEITKMYGYVVIQFTPHNSTIKQYKSMLDSSSIRSYYSGIPYVVIRTKELKDKFAKIFTMYGIE